VIKIISLSFGKVNTLNYFGKTADFRKIYCNSNYNSYASNRYDGLIVGEEISSFCTEDETYERFCEAADAYIGAPIHATAHLAPSSRKDREQLFKTRIRAIYRASVWGQFSLLCSGIVSPYELCTCLDALNDAFCELESESREFNGFIRKGICIDTPMLLYSFPSRSKFDFLCFDFYKLLELCTDEKCSDEACRELSDAIRRICVVHEKSEVSIKVYANSNYENIIKFLYPLEIKEIYLFQ